jgi:hypothetical protein
VCSAAHATAARVAKAEREAARLAGKPIRHGTAAGFTAHVRRAIPPCDGCIEAERARKRKPAGAGSRRRPPCGTRQGYEAHCRRFEAACTPCKAAKATYRRDQLAVARKAREQATAEAAERVDALLDALGGDS